MSSTLRAVAVASLCLLAGCGGGVGGDDRTVTVNPALAETPAATQTPSPTASPTVTPAYTVAGATSVDVYRLARRHGRALRARGGVVRFLRTASVGERVVLRRSAVGRVNDSRIVYRQRASRDPDVIRRPLGPNVTAWAAGDRTAVRYPDRPGGPLVRTTTDGPRVYHDQSASGRATVFGSLSEWELRDAGPAASGDGARLLVNVAETARRGDGRRVRNLSVRVVVGETGVVRSATVRYEATLAGRTVTVRDRFRTTAVGDVTVSRPAWAADGTATEVPA